MTRMTDTEAREIFDAALAATTDPDARARIELVREYFTNAEFRSAFAAEVWRLNGGAN